jgi:hypothetical protein
MKMLAENVSREVLNSFFAEVNIEVIPSMLFKKLTVLHKLLGDDLPDLVVVRDVEQSPILLVYEFAIQECYLQVVLVL